MELKGNFEASSIASILQMLHNDGKTGELRFQKGKREVLIFLKDGNIVYARANHMEMRLGSLLRSKGIITANQLQECLESAKKNKQALGKTMVGDGYITEDTLRKVLCKQAKDVIYSVFLWSKGSFIYNDCQDIPPGILVTPLDIMSIVMEATRRQDEMMEIREKIPEDQCLFRMTDKLKNKKDLKVSPVEWRFISLIDGSRTVRKLINESGYDAFSVYRVLNTLLGSGLIEPSDGEIIGNTKWDAGYSAIIGVYVDVIFEVCRSMKDRMSSWPYLVMDITNPVPGDLAPGIRRELRRNQIDGLLVRLIDSCKPEIVPEDKDIFKSFQVETDQDVFIHVVLEAVRDMEDVEQGRAFLIDNFDVFLKNLLFCLPQAIGLDPTKAVLSEVDKIIRYVRKYHRSLTEKTEAVEKIQNVLGKMSTLLAERTEGVDHGQKLFLVTPS